MPQSGSSFIEGTALPERSERSARRPNANHSGHCPTVGVDSASVYLVHIRAQSGHAVGDDRLGAENVPSTPIGQDLRQVRQQLYGSWLNRHGAEARRGVHEQGNPGVDPRDAAILGAAIALVDAALRRYESFRTVRGARCAPPSTRLSTSAPPPNLVRRTREFRAQSRLNFTMDIVATVPARLGSRSDRIDDLRSTCFSRKAPSFVPVSAGACLSGCTSSFTSAKKKHGASIKSRGATMWTPGFESSVPSSRPRASSHSCSP